PESDWPRIEGFGAWQPGRPLEPAGLGPSHLPRSSETRCRARGRPGQGGRRTEPEELELLEHAGCGPLPGRKLERGCRSPGEGDCTPRPRRYLRLVLPRHGLLATGQQGRRPQVVRACHRVDGQEPAEESGTPSVSSGGGGTDQEGVRDQEPEKE